MKQELIPLIKKHYQWLLAIIILGTTITQYQFARDFVTGGLEYSWNFATITSYDTKLFTIMFAVGAITWYYTSKAKKTFIKWRRNAKIN